MNGSIVFLRGDDPEEEEIVVDTDDGGSLTIPYGETATLRLAYAISVHKAQGCEVPVVIGVCHRSHTRMLTRPLLYTAITRARSTCVLVGDRGGAGRPRSAATTAAAATRAWRSACAGDRGPHRAGGGGLRLEAASGRDRHHPGGDRAARRAGARDPRAAPRLRGGDAGRLRRGPRRAGQPRRRRAAADPRPRPDPRRRLLPGRDRRRRGRLRLRLLPGAGPGDGRLAALGVPLLRGRPLGGAAAARPLARRRAASSGPRR